MENGVPRRYLTRFDTHRMGQVSCDVLVIGSGVAGLRAAIEASRSADTLLVCKKPLKRSNSWWAQGGVAVVHSSQDSVDLHVDDTLSVGCGLCDANAVRMLVERGPALVGELADWGCPFDRTADGTILLSREGGHHADRIVHAMGDATGKAMVQTLQARLTGDGANVRIFEDCFIIDLLTDRDGTCVGAISHHAKYGHQVIWARQTILASGGAGQVYRETTNPDVATGDGHAMAYRAGATLRDMEFMQFHPTTLYVAGASRSLISEAVRGEGALLVHRDGSRFMDRYHEMAELAPRDVVSQSILRELIQTGATSVYLDARHFSPGHFARRFPRISEQLAKFDIDPQRDLIPIRPSAHYMIGGVRTDLSGACDVPGLYVVGEAASTGVHGANRLASNSLLEGLVFGTAAGAQAAQRAGEQAGSAESRRPRIRSEVPDSDRTELDVDDVRSSLRSVVWRNVGIERCQARLEETQDIIAFWSRYVLDKVFDAPSDWELQNLLTVARLMTTAAGGRRETRGTHCRTDFPSRDDERWQHHIELRRPLSV